MEFFNDPQFVYLMGVLWMINGSIVSNVSASEHGAMVFQGFIIFGSWFIGIGHIIYAIFMVQ